MLQPFDDNYFMRQALLLAQHAASIDEVPVGAVVVYQNKIIGKGYNQVEQLQDVTAHAEIIAITAAAQAIGSKFLNDSTLYVTLEPCMMCAGASLHARVGKIVFGAYDVKSPFSGKINDFLAHHTIVGGVMEAECKEILVNYFKGKRKV